MPDQIREHLRHEALVGGGSNMVLNALGAWLLTRDGPALGWGMSHSFLVDIIATAFLLPAIVALFVIPLQRKKFSREMLPPIILMHNSIAQSIALRCPDTLMPGALFFGLLGIVLFVPLTLLGFYLLGITEIAPLHYAVFKGVWAGLMAATLIPPMVLSALRSPTPPTTQTQQ